MGTIVKEAAKVIIQSMFALWDTDGGGMGEKTKFEGLFEEKHNDGPFALWEKVDVIIIDDQVYVHDTSYKVLSISDINVNLTARKQQRKQAALAKLTPEDIAALGLTTE